MSLTWREQRSIEEIERHLRADDPTLVRALTNASARMNVQYRRSVAHVGIWIGWAVMIIGFANARGLVSGGMIVGCYGLILMVISGTAAIRLWRRPAGRIRRWAKS